MKFLLAIAVLICALAASAQEPQSLEELIQLAEQGDANAQFNLGAAYDEGTGVGQDYAEAVRWYRLSAEQGDASAQYNLGGMYDEGTGVGQDDAEAVRWWTLAAEQGDADAQNNLGLMQEYRDYAFGFFFGALIMTWLVSRGFLAFMKNRVGGFRRLVYAHAASLVVTSYVGGISLADGGPSAAYLLPQCVWLAVDSWRLRKGKRPKNQ